MSYSSYPTSTHKYAYVWEKYRPVFLKLMMSSEEGPQQYKFSSHEIKSANPTGRSHTFLLKIHKGRAVNDIRESPIAKDLLWVLQNSGKAAELADVSTYTFSLDRNFVLQVMKESIEKEVAEVEKEAVEVEKEAAEGEKEGVAVEVKA
jgi:hypothetical protein